MATIAELEKRSNKKIKNKSLIVWFDARRRPSILLRRALYRLGNAFTSTPDVVGLVSLLIMVKHGQPKNLPFESTRSF